ncbi:MAG: O-methyltransferase [Candidatus Acidiferrales bacterium]
MNLISRLKSRALRWSFPFPFLCRHAEYSILASLDDDSARPNGWLLDISLLAIQRARQADLSWLSNRMASPPYYPEIWPGEHYKLLAGLVAAQQPMRVVEVGTAQGWSALAMQGSLPLGGELITFDIAPWTDFGNTALRASDFESGNLRQMLGDLSDKAFFSQCAELLSGCDLLFVDAPKDGVFEPAFLERLSTIQLPPNALVVFDDVRLRNMLKIWREIKRPKLDLTSFGHWTGTGLVDWNG